MACGITDGIDSNCLSLKRVGGVLKTAYVTNLEDIASYNIDVSGYITAIIFDAYKGLYKFDSRKQAHSGGSTAVVQEPGGNKFYQHDVILKMFANTPEDDQILEELLVANVVVILETTNRQFFLYGTYNGLEESAAVQNTGQASGSDIADNITLIGGEEEKPKRVLNTDFTTTKNQLETYVI